MLDTLRFILENQFYHYNALYLRKAGLNDEQYPVICAMIVELRHNRVWGVYTPYKMTDLLSNDGRVFFKIKDVLSGVEAIIDEREFVTNYEVYALGQYHEERCIPIGNGFRTDEDIQREKEKDPKHLWIAQAGYIQNSNWDNIYNHLCVCAPNMVFNDSSIPNESLREIENARKTHRFRLPSQNIKAYWVFNDSRYILLKYHDFGNQLISTSPEVNKILSSKDEDYDYLFKKYFRWT